MAYDRTYIDGLKDLLTLPSRLDAAFWESIDALMGRGSARSIWNIIFEPAAANEEDLKSFSERYLGLSSGVTKFLVDTATSPLTLMGMGFTRGGGAFRLHNEGPVSEMTKQVIKDRAPLMASAQPYAKLMDKLGLVKARGAEILMHFRQGKFMNQFVPEYENIRRGFNVAEWEQAKPRIALYLDGRQVPHITQKEIEAADAIRNRVLDPIWDRIGTIERLTKNGDEFVADSEPIGYLSGYFAHMMNRQGWLSNDPKRIIEAIESNPKYKQLLRDKIIEPLPFTPDTSISLSSQRDAWLNWMQQPAAASIFNPFMLKRSGAIVPDELMDKLFILDLDKVIPSYVQKASKTYALQTHLSADEARVLTGRVIDDPVPVEEITRLHGMIRSFYRQQQPLRQAYNDAAAKGWDEATLAPLWSQIQTLGLNEQAAKKAVQGLYQRVRETPEQHSLAYQVTLEAAHKLGYDPTKSAAGGIATAGLTTDQRIRARLFHEWYSLLIGKQDPERFTLGNAYAAMMSKVNEWLTPQRIAEIDAMGQKVGAKNLSRKVVDHVTRYSDTYEAQGIEKMLVGYTTMNLLGFKPSAVLINMLQTPQMTVPHIGFGNTIAGIREGVPRLAKAYREGLRVYLADRRAGRLTSFKEALRQGFNQHLPEFMSAGIPLDMHAFERVYGESFLPSGAFDLDKFTNIALAPFSAAEHMNRVIAFYGARNGFREALKYNPAAFGYDAAKVTADQLASDMNLHAASVVYDTQFVPTAGRLTPATKRLGPVGRQFLNYPISFANSMMDLATRGAVDARASQFGAALGKAYGGKRSMLGYARYLAVMSGMTNFGHDVLGMNLGERVQEGILNLPLDPATPFAPLPIPPIPGALLAYAQSALEGRMNPSATTDIPGMGSIPIPKAFVPGGMALSQFARIMNQTKDGMMLDRNGRGLYNFDTKATVATVLGLTTTESARDQMKVKRLLYTADKVKAYRHELATALNNADMAAADSARARYARDFPTEPPLSVAQRDVIRVREQERTTRLQRVAKSVGSQIRGIIDPSLDPAGWHEPYDLSGTSTRGFN